MGDVGVLGMVVCTSTRPRKRCREAATSSDSWRAPGVKGSGVSVKGAGPGIKFRQIS